MMGEMVPANATETGSTVSKKTAMGLPKRLACEKWVKRPEKEARGVYINTCSASSPTGS